jgi:hypothetical protein
VKKFVKQIAKLYATDEAAAQEFKKFWIMRQDPGWAEMVRIIHIVQGLMAEEMFSVKFTELSGNEKDIRQRVFAGIRIFLTFLANPSPELERAMFLAGHDKVVKEIMQRPQKAPAKRR